jgi:predicted metal-dependent peptidase
MDAQKKIAICRTKLMLQHPFFGSMAMSCGMKQDDDHDTMYTDGKDIGYSSAFVDAHTVEEIMGVVAHEIAHIFMGHHIRMGKRDHEQWNIACDYAINGWLTDSGMVLPQGGLIDPQYTGMTAEKIYDLLPPQPPEGGEGGGWGEVKQQKNADGSDLSQGQVKQEQASIKQRAMMAANAAKSVGKLPAAIEEIIAKMRRVTVDWGDVVRRFAGGDQPDDYTFSRPQKKYWTQQRIWYPSVKKLGVGDWVIAPDTSGSMSGQELEMALGVINQAIEDYQPESVTIITWSGGCTRHTTLAKGETMPQLECDDRGGTNVEPLFRYVRDNQIGCDKMFVVSDMGIWDYPDTVPDYPVLWLSTAPDSRFAKTPPFGDIAVIEEAA